jgi:hypothetical protein
MTDTPPVGGAEWTEEFVLRSFGVEKDAKVALIGARRNHAGVVHVDVPCKDQIHVHGPCVDPESFGPTKPLADSASRSLEFILNAMVVQHLARCEKCPDLIPPELLAMSYGASEMRTFITGDPHESPMVWQKKWKLYAGNTVSTFTIMLLFRLIYPKATFDLFQTFRDAGARVVWDQERKEKSGDQV